MSGKLRNTERLDDDSRFDRLVDGELSPSEYRSLLATLDDEPGGWRRCALAFLEAQALRRELGALRAGGSPLETAPAATQQLATNARPATTRWLLPLAMAASFLVAFGLGVYLPAWLATDRPSPVAGLVAPEQTAADPPTAPRPSPKVVEARPGTVVPVGSVKLVVDRPGAPATETSELPVYEMTDDLAAWLSQDQPAIPPSVLAEIERRGHRIDRQRQYVPVTLDDGRQAVIPVDGIEITPVSRRAY
ncbi:MAG: hypothetical protein SFU86_13445 [Pirellulaceae bacterium]|nr:hypothetical protein [Pirellulaceae bacterium]